MAGRKIKMKINGPTMEDAFDQFLVAKTADGLSQNTIKAYRGQFYAVARFWDISRSIGDVTEKDVREVFAAMARTELSRNSIRSYSATLQTFFSWCRSEGLSRVTVKLFRGVDSVPEIYTEAELKRLLKHPPRRTTFTEMRTWAVINLLVNNGPRASTVCAIRVGDVHLDQSVIILRKTKNRRALSIPLGATMVSILKEYMRIRSGEPDEPLFCAIDGTQLSTDGLRHSINRYNHSRGVKKTGVHAFRHTFARLYLVDCHGSALKLQRLLGHSTLEMTKHYVQIFDRDLVDDFKTASPLEKIMKKV